MSFQFPGGSWVIPEPELSKVSFAWSKDRSILSKMDSKTQSPIFSPIKLTLTWILSGRCASSLVWYEAKQGLLGCEKEGCAPMVHLVWWVRLKENRSVYGNLLCDLLDRARSLRPLVTWHSVRKQTEKNAGVQLALTFSSCPGPHTTNWYYP